MQFPDAVQPDGTCVLTLSGDVDLAVVDHLIGRVRECLAQAEKVEADFEGVTFLDSSGLGALVLVHNEAAEQGKSFSLVNVSPATSRLLELSGLRDSLVKQEEES